MAYEKAELINVKAKIALTGVSGSGKTFSSLVLATGLANGGMIGMLDTEGDRGLHYATKFDYYRDSLEDTTPENYIKKIDEAYEAGVKVLIVDSLSHEWKTLMEIKDAMPGNNFTNFAKITPRHDKLLKKIMNIDMHIIATIRSKEKYTVEVNSKGKQAPVKLGLGLEQRDGIEYEFTAVMNIEHETHKATLSKGTTNIFNSLDCIITEEHGKDLLLWCTEGIDKDEQIIGSEKALITLGFLENKGIDKEKFINYIADKYTVGSAEFLKNKDYKEIFIKLNRAKFDIDKLINEEVE